MMQLDPGRLSQKENYKWLIGTVLPRPIAFVTSISASGVVNAAPFSFFNVVATEPPMVGFACMRKPDGEMKDTAKNIIGQREFVVHTVSEENVALVNETAVDFPPDQSEAEKVGLHLLPATVVRVPRIQEAKIHMECRLHCHLPIGGNGRHPNADFLIGEVVWVHLDEGLYDQGKVDTGALKPVGRMAGRTYVKGGDMFSMPRLSYDQWLLKHKKAGANNPG